jgi:hypothetical protein
MAFISGPRQVGKSTLAKQLLQSKENYFLFDESRFAAEWIKSPQLAVANRSLGPIVLDEIHKDRLWKRRLKGLYDNHPNTAIIVTGSARLDTYRRGSDSLMGRYLPYRLHPITVAENAAPIQPDHILEITKPRFAWSDLMQLGGFPEPLLAGNEREAQRWSRLRVDQLAFEDVRDFLNLSDHQSFRALLTLIPDRIGSLLSIHALHEDVGKAYATVRNWFHVLESLYFCFTIKPYSKNLRRVNRAEPKLYLFDILRISKELSAKRLENLTALHLLKMCHFWTDTAYGEFNLHFVRNKDGREADFLIVKDQQPWMLIECKSAQKEPASDLLYYQQLLKPKYSIQLIDANNHDRQYPAHGVRVMDYQRFFAGTV